ncbi:carbon-nitrogen hydrolase family protein [Nitratireductor luteus]|uniref:carbon-nitrogen hydrolase family protein n=1 Tax=Nitratireductor luteus TaxID=2976980 RepID=UPI00223F5BE3|nr:carbon-nitrogen hydrolase family protein [Nitratireductor luteus]
MTTFRAAALQMRSGMTVATNVAEFERLVRDAAKQGAHYVQSPEMTGLLVRDRAQLLDNITDEAKDPLVARAARLARECGLFVHVGSTAIAVGGGKVANRAFLFGPDGERIATYDKIHMFDVDLDNGESWRESATYAPGEATLVVDLPMAALGFAICYDLRFPQLFRTQAMTGAQVLTAPAAFTRQTGEAHWHVLTRARAIENGAFLIAAAQGGRHEDGRETYGHSIIVDPWGKVLAEAAHDEPAVVVADIDVEQSRAARGKIPNLANAREFNLARAFYAETVS